ncbi:hypothetical protein [Acinetobacter larvae]|uniref:Uncharacterized protein n=1 Tax=Acinetobacter larvae TaxID=1789224 RepID=A0A1B2LZ05_9GAMM|nr:hypothetical protein [Acinetobacter larvae]AOA58192.1 hypothetical protein BFG52_07390 [Acinetobacter larvae]
MKSNISKPAVASNDTATDYIVGDVVVYEDGITGLSSLQTIEAYQPDDHYWLAGGQLVHVSHIRHATTAEITARRRLSVSLDGVLTA